MLGRSVSSSYLPLFPFASSLRLVLGSTRARKMRESVTWQWLSSERLEGRAAGERELLGPLGRTLQQAERVEQGRLQVSRFSTSLPGPGTLAKQSTEGCKSLILIELHEKPHHKVPSGVGQQWVAAHACLDGG